MTLRYAETADAIVVFPAGSTFFDNPPDLGPNSEMEDLCRLAKSADKKLIIDLQSFQLMNSRLLAILVLFHKRSAKHTVDLRFANVRANLREVINITQLDRIFRFDDYDGDGPDLFGAAVPLPKPPSTNSGQAESKCD